MSSITTSDQLAPAVLITGVSSGIGEATALYLANRGYRVFGSVRQDKDAESLKNKLGTNFTPLIFDVCNSNEVNQSIETLSRLLPEQPLAALINNAGVATLGPLECLDDAQFKHSIDVNVLGVRHIINACLPIMRGEHILNSHSDIHIRRKIINISSLSGILNTPVSGAYCVSKHALESLGEVYRRELLPQGIDVVSIRSGPIQSRIWVKNTTESIIGNRHPHYKNMVASAQSLANRAAKSAISAEVIAAQIYKILLGRKNGSHYEIGSGACLTRLLGFLPERLADRLIVRSMMKGR